MKTSLIILEGWSISLQYDNENMVISILDPDSSTASIPLDDIEMSLFIKQLNMMVEAKSKEHD